MIISILIFFIVVFLIFVSEKPNCFIKTLTRFIEFFENKTEETENNYKFYDLSPEDGLEEKACGKLLKFGLENEKVLNIAVTGPYGSGKSSFLKSFERKNLNYNYLNISLASFRDDIGKDINTKNKIEKIIEENILQQIIYKESADRLPNSRIKRIKEINFISFLSKVILLYIWLNIFYLRFKKEAWKDYESLFIDFEEGKLKMILSIVLLGGIFYFIYSLVRNFGINKITIKAFDNEIELGNNKETSVFYKYLDEIIYFFKKTRYDVVFFEDIDRFEKINVDLFTKLRELNGLLNNSADIKRDIKFVYAVKDNLFEDEIEVETDKGKEKIRNEETHKLRTKFFDLIVPIIPFVDYSNSSEEMKKNICDDYLSEIINEEKCNKIKKRINNFCLYINDMRIVNNISNEFKVYRENINGSLKIKVDDEKLLGYIVYKNLYPKDFSDLHNKKGMVYTALTDKSKIKEDLKNIPIIELLKRMNKKDIFHKDICEEEILIDLLKDGIIDEDYSLYISFFKEGRKTRNDIEYMRAFRNGEDNLVDYKIDNPQIVIEEYLYEGDFEKIEIVNFYLIDYIIRNKEKYALHYEKLINFINKKIENFVFVENILPIIDKEEEVGLESKNYKNSILKTFSKEIKNFWSSIEIYCLTMEIKKEKYMYLILEKCNVNEILNDKEALANSINSDDNFLLILEVQLLNYMKKNNGQKYGLKLWITNLEENLIYLGIKIKKLDFKENNNIFDIIYNNHLYEISHGNIINIMEVKCNLSGEENTLLETQPYTLISNKKSELKQLKDYVDNNIQEFVKNVILSENSKVQESAEILIRLYKLPEKILDNKIKIKLIENQNNIVNDISGLSLEVQNSLIERRKILINWYNINQNFICNKYVLNDSVVNFFNDLENAKKISENHISSEGDYSSENMGFLGKAIVKEDKIYDESYIFLINSLYDWDLPNLEDIPKNKLKLLVKFNKIELNSNNFEKIISVSQESLIEYILNNRKIFLDNFEIFNEILMCSEEFNSNFIEVYSKFFENLNSNEKINFISNFSLAELDRQDKLWTQIKEFINTLENFGIESSFKEEKSIELLEADFLPIIDKTVDILHGMVSDGEEARVEAIVISKKYELLEKIKELELGERVCEILYDVLNTIEDKIQFINNISLNLIYKNSELIEEIIDFILSEKLQVDFEIFEKLIKISEEGIKIEMLLSQIDFLSNEEIKNILFVFGNNYKKIINNPMRSTFDKSDVDIRILNKLKEKEILSKVNQNNNKITVIKNQNLKW